MSGVIDRITNNIVKKWYETHIGEHEFDRRALLAEKRGLNYL